MNNAKMWLVVKPTVGVPLFLGAVAVGSFAVHVAVLSNTTWVSNFLSGSEMASADVTTEGSHFVSAPKAVGDRFTVTLPDGTKAVAVVESGPTVVASNVNSE